MLEDDERRTIAVSVTATKLTAQTLAKALQKVLQQMRELHRNAQTPQGRQSVKKLMKCGYTSYARYSTIRNITNITYGLTFGIRWVIINKNKCRRIFVIWLLSEAESKIYV